MKSCSLSILTVAGTLLCASVHAAFPPVWPPPPPCTDPPFCPYFPSFQGFLTDQGLPANGLYDIITRIYDAPTGGNLIGPPTTNRNVQVQSGLFTIYVRVPDGLSGMPLPDGEDTWWIEHCIQHPEDPICQVIEPRQRISPTVQSLYANLAASVKDGAVTASKLAPAAVGNIALGDGSVTASKLAPGAVGNIGLGDGSITANKIANGAVVRSINGLREDLMLAAGEGITLSTMGNAIHIAAPGPAVRDCRDYTNCYWNLLGNGNITPGTHFLGTIAGELAPLELRVHGNRAIMFEHTGANTSPNITGGYLGNLVSGVGGTIGGGGQLTGINKVTAAYGTVSGGWTNAVSGPSSTIGGGDHNAIVFADTSTIGGGTGNLIDNQTAGATIGGGGGNTIGPVLYFPTIGGGDHNRIDAHWATVSGGNNNRIRGSYSAVGGGNFNEIDPSYSAVGGGDKNRIQPASNASTISGGEDNLVSTNAPHASIGGGEANVVHRFAHHGTISGGGGNAVIPTAQYGTVSGGATNIAGNRFASVGGGNINAANGSFATVAGGEFNGASAQYSTVGGGATNKATGAFATVPGGARAVASHYGELAHASGRFANDGDAQAAFFVLRTNTTPLITAGELLLDGVSQRMTVPVGSTWSFEALISARSTTGLSAGYSIRGVIENVGGVTTMLLPAAAPPLKVILGEDVAGWDANVVADDVNDALVIYVQGDQSDIRWVAQVRTTQVSNP